MLTVKDEVGTRTYLLHKINTNTVYVYIVRLGAVKSLKESTGAHIRIAIIKIKSINFIGTIFRQFCLNQFIFFLN